jgi:hypothetical protein
MTRTPSPDEPSATPEALAERVAAIRARIRRSVEDPRPAIRLAEVQARLRALHALTVAAQDPESR